MKNIRFLVFIVLFVCIIGGIIALFSLQASGGNSKLISKTAYIEGTNINASFKMAGRISELLVDEGEQVKKGQVLARLESKELENKVAQAKAALQLAEAKIEEASSAKLAAATKEEQGNEAVKITEATIESAIKQAEAAVTAANANVQALEAQISTAKEVYDITTTNYNRAVALHKEGAAAQIQVDEAKSTMEQAKAEYYALLEQKKAAEAQVAQAEATLENAVANRGKITLSKKDVEVANATVAQAEGAVAAAISGKKQAEAALAEAETYLSYTELVAPADGVILTKSSELGEIVNAGFPIYTIETTDTRYAEFYFDENEITGLKIGDPITVELAATKQLLDSKITNISPAGDFAVQKATQSIGDMDIRSFKVKIKFIDLPSDIPTGMTVQWIGKGEEK